MAVNASSAARFALYRSVGEVLTQFDVDVENATLTQRGSITLPGNVQYVWPGLTGTRGKFFYVTSSDGGSASAGVPGTVHRLSALRVDSATGALSLHGEPQALPSRPIHNCVDATGSYIITAYNGPSNITVHRINADGSAGNAVAPSEKLDTGIFAHQVMMTPNNRAALLVTRGNDAAKGKPEDPGALKFYSFRDGILSPLASISPGGRGGLGYGPRHVDFHPEKPWMYASIERQNKLHMHTLDGDVVSAEPLFVKDTLSAPNHSVPRQMCSAVHVHPSGRFVYVANRADSTVDFNGQRVFNAGENTIAAYRINPSTGEPTLIQHVDAQTYHVRTFAFDPSGRLMVAASTHAMRVRDGETVRNVPAAMSVYRVGDDGKLAFVHKIDVETPGKKTQFWLGILKLA
ncbi:MAG: beta-propeller fold lactonase family protein [Burkholderiales bacterium]